MTTPTGKFTLDNLQIRWSLNGGTLRLSPPPPPGVSLTREQVAAATAKVPAAILDRWAAYDWAGEAA